MDRPSVTPPIDRHARAVRMEDAGRSACLCSHAPSAFFVSWIDVPSETLISRFGSRKISARWTKCPNRRGYPAPSFRAVYPMGPTCADACHAGRPQAAVLWIHPGTLPPLEIGNFEPL